MTGAARFASDEPSFDLLVELVKRKLDIDVRLPGWPFRDGTGFAHIVEYDRLLGGSFAAVLEALVRACGDECVTVVGLEPQTEYYRDGYGLFPGFQVDSTELEMGYPAGLRYEPRGDPTGALAYSVNVMAVVGSSGAWSVWGQRDWEIALVLTPRDAGPWRGTPVPVFGRDIDLNSIRSPAGWGVKLSDGDLERFSQNLRTRGSGDWTDK